MTQPTRSVDVQHLRSVLDYNPETGVFVWRAVPERTSADKRRNAIWAGKIAGALRKDQGYRHIKVAGTFHYAHRLAWAYVHGDLPDVLIDHINGDKDDNRIANLRPASVSENGANARVRADSTSGVKGVDWRADAKRWRVRVGTTHVGYFKTKEAAAAAYLNAAKKHFGEFATSGMSSFA